MERCKFIGIYLDDGERQWENLNNCASHNNSKLGAFSRLEASRKVAKELIDYEAEREKRMNEKYGIIV